MRGRFWRSRWFRIWILMLATALGMALVFELTHNDAVVPAAMFYGAAAGPVAMLIATHDRTGLGDSVPAATLLGTFLFGGGVGLMFAGLFDAEFVKDEKGPEILAVGFIEETAKILVPLGIALTGQYLTKRAGVAIGLASATGFAVLESMSYGYSALAGGTMVDAEVTLVARGLTTPFSHLAWTGLVCAIAFGVWERRGRVVVTPVVVGGWLLAAVLHSANDFLLTISSLPTWRLLLYLVVALVSYWLFHRLTHDLNRRPAPEVTQVRVEGAGYPEKSSHWRRWRPRRDSG
ncbi:PrsW family intramembrane metalloprotease [Nonomuraea sp. NBC_01738]|uniref:PrsW family intramembrane metalloprotease n=1 Tax=Nonomuraea sp. NBC_01738 TaxID=2976003 RepID=UPI002E13C56B|nr:PrsW family intramembrane metalloprotease [Nonomuraea sp. NBC_01738]